MMGMISRFVGGVFDHGEVTGHRDPARTKQWIEIWTNFVRVKVIGRERPVIQRERQGSHSLGHLDSSLECGFPPDQSISTFLAGREILQDKEQMLTEPLHWNPNVRPLAMESERSIW